MANARNQSDPLPQDSSNVVIFQMMMHYKRRMEIAEDEAEHYKKRSKIMEEIWEDEINTAHDRLDIEIRRNRQIMQTNQRGAFMTIRKHAAGMRLINCLDEIFTAVDTAGEAGESEDALQYIYRVREGVQARAGIAFEMLIAEHRDDELETDEEIDLTGETTEEDEIEL